MKETAVRSRKGGGKTPSHRTASIRLRTDKGTDATKSSLHVCPHCRRAFPFRVALQLHIKDHLVQDAFKCSLCPAGFSSKYQRSVHLRRHAGIDLFRCDQCRVKFINASNLQRHIRNGVCHKTQDIREGDREGYPDSSTAGDDHNLSDVKMKPQSSLRDRVNVAVTNLHSCEACNETFTSLEDFSHHKDLHKTGNIFTCRNCSKNFCTLPRLSGETLGEDEKYWRNKCMLCGSTCHSDNDLFIHLRRHLDNNEDLYCKQCQSSRVESESKGNHSALNAGGETNEQHAETVPVACLSSNCVTSPAPPATTSSHCPPALSQVRPYQTSTYFTTNLNNFVGTLYQSSDLGNSQQRTLPPVCNVVPAAPPCSIGGSSHLCADDSLAQTPGIMATAAPSVYMVNPVMRCSQSFPCSAQILSPSAVESGGLVPSCVSPAWSATAVSAVAVTSASGPPNLVSCFAPNTQTSLVTSGSCYANQTLCCSPSSQQ